MFKFINSIDGRPVVIGQVERSLNGLQTAGTKEFEITNPNTGRRVGVMVIDDLRIIERPSFLSYLQSGWGISLAVAIDFTGSNGDPRLPTSLHYLGAYNQYEQATRAVGSILECYDSDKSFPVYGFGGIPRFMNQISVNHCFPLNGNYSSPEVVGTEGILALYRQNLASINLNGPTYFSHILN